MRRRFPPVLAVLVLALVPAVSPAGSQDNAKIALHLGPDHPIGKNDACSFAPTEFACDDTGFSPQSNLAIAGAVEQAYSLYIVVLDYDVAAGVQGAALGLRRSSSVYLVDYVQCFEGITFSSGGWPDPGWSDGVQPPLQIEGFLAADDCLQAADPSDPQGEGAWVLGAFYVYAYSSGGVCVTPRPSVPPSSGGPDLKIADCTAAESSIPEFAAGTVGFGLPGYDPCLMDPGYLSPDGRSRGAAEDRPLPCDEVVRVRPATWGGIKRQFGGD